VDGKISIGCYLEAAEQCYQGLKAKSGGTNIIQDMDYFCFHSPFYKMVQKAFASIVKL
jgi:hydroxymethylglutaryl-CoA synthase